MALFEGTGISIFTSDNLKDWQYSSHTPGFWECPELFEIPVDGDINNKKWVMYGASGTYKIGEFDGSTFIMESGKHYYHRGALYAAQTYNNVPDGRRIQIGWGRIPAPEMPFNQMMTFPSELTLRTTNSGVRLFIEPIDEIKSLHKGEYIWDNILLTKEKPRVFEQVNDPLLHIVAEFEIQTGRGFGLVVHGYKISYDMNHNLLNDTFVSPVNNSLYLDILVDRNSIEIFANHGRFYIAQSHNSIDQPKQLECFTLQGETLLKRLEVYPLKSVW
jgi:sucrose-6-phosphate hydrolase SacC (GH32 family)